MEAIQRLFKDTMIKQVIFNMGGLKAPGLNGLIIFPKSMGDYQGFNMPIGERGVS